MRRMKAVFSGLVVVALYGTAGLAQDSAGQGAGHSMEAPPLPEACKAPEGMQMPRMQSMPDMPGTSEVHQDMMAGMMRMQSGMMAGMLAEDTDVAFVCGMLVHHRGAVEMAEAELRHGDDRWAKEMAQNVIDAQTQEIAEMTEWLDRQAE